MIDRVIREALQDILARTGSFPQDLSLYLSQRGIESREFEAYINTDHRNVIDSRIKERYLQLKDMYCRR